MKAMSPKSQLQHQKTMHAKAMCPANDWTSTSTGTGCCWTWTTIGCCCCSTYCGAPNPGCGGYPAVWITYGACPAAGCGYCCGPEYAYAGGTAGYADCGAVSIVLSSYTQHTTLPLRGSFLPPDALRLCYCKSSVRLAVVSVRLVYTDPVALHF